nr:transposase [Alteromonas sp. IB21]
MSKQVVAIYRQRMQIEEGSRDMKSTKFGLGYKQDKSVKKQRLTILILLTTLASLVAILLSMVLVSSHKHRRF